MEDTESVGSQPLIGTPLLANPRSPDPNNSISKTQKLVDRVFIKPDADDEDDEDGTNISNDKINACFSRFMVGVIIVNGIALGAGKQWPTFTIGTVDMFCLLDAFFALFYVLEVGVKWTKMGVKGYFWHGQGLQGWNTLDFFLTILAVVNLSLRFLIVSSSVSGNMGTLSVLRLFRLLRIVRLLEQIPSLAMTLGGVWGSIGPLFWIVVALFFNTYAFALLFVDTVRHCDDDVLRHEDAPYHGHPRPLKDTIMQDCSTCYEDLFTAMKTLTDVVVLEAWTETLPQSQPELLVPFFVYALISSFGVMNVIIGVMVDATAQTQVRLQWTAKSRSLVSMGEMWEDKIDSRGLGVSALESCETEWEQEQKIEERQIATEQIITEIIESQVVRFPQGITAEETHMFIDKDGDGMVRHEELVCGIGQILLGNDFQLQVLSFVNQGTIHRWVKELHMDELSEYMAEKRRMCDHNNQRLDKIQQALEEIKNAVQPMNQRLGELKQAVQHMKKRR